MMPERECAGAWMCRQIGAEPQFLVRSYATAANRGAIRIQGDEMPSPDVEAVVPPATLNAAWIERGGPFSKVAVIAGSVARLVGADFVAVSPVVVLMIAGNRPDQILEYTP